MGLFFSLGVAKMQCNLPVYHLVTATKCIKSWSFSYNLFSLCLYIWNVSYESMICPIYVQIEHPYTLNPLKKKNIYCQCTLLFWRNSWHRSFPPYCLSSPNASLSSLPRHSPRALFLPHCTTPWWFPSQGSPTCCRSAPACRRTTHSKAQPWPPSHRTDRSGKRTITNSP